MEIIQREKAINIPNLLTFMRLAMLPVVVWRYACGDFSGALIWYLAAMLTDIADGFAARAMHQSTALGKLLDPAADKLFQLTLLALFVHAGQVPVWVLGFVVIKESVLVIGSLSALSRGLVVSAMPVGKITTAVFVASSAARLLSLHTAADSLLSIYILLSMIALGRYACACCFNLSMTHEAS